MQRTVDRAPRLFARPLWRVKGVLHLVTKMIQFFTCRFMMALACAQAGARHGQRQTKQGDRAQVAPCRGGRGGWRGRAVVVQGNAELEMGWSDGGVLELLGVPMFRKSCSGRLWLKQRGRWDGSLYTGM